MIKKNETKEIIICHKKLTDEEEYNKIKKLYKKNPKTFMSPKLWKKLRIKQLKKEGKIWGK